MKRLPTHFGPGLAGLGGVPQVRRTRPIAGGALLAALAIIALLAILAGTALQIASGLARTAERADRFDRARVDADSAVEVAFADWRSRIEAGDPTVPLSPEALADPVPPGGQELPGLDVGARALTAAQDLEADPGRAGAYRLNGYRVSLLTQPSVERGDAPNVRAQGISSGAGIYRYLASAQISVPGLGSPATAEVRSVFEQRLESVWDYSVLFTRNLRVTSDVRFAGWTHTNGVLDARDAPGAMPGRVTASGGVRRAGVGEEAVPLTVLPAPPKQVVGGVTDPADGNPNNDGLRELIETRDPLHPDPFAAIRLPGLAGVEVRWSDAGVSLHSGSGRDPLPDNLGTALLACFQEGVAVPDPAGTGPRAGVAVDLATLRELVRGQGVPGWNGILHLNDLREGDRAFLLRNGAELPPGGVVIVTSGALYVQGDFNTGQGEVPSNAAADAGGATTAEGYVPQPAVLAADGVVVVSGGWQEGVGIPTAGSITLNAAILAGAADGGSEAIGPADLIRRIEDWSGASLTLQGALLQLFDSQGIGGNAIPGARPPARTVLRHDPAFLHSPPPVGLVVVSYGRTPAALGSDLAGEPVASNGAGSGKGKGSGAGKPF